MPQRSRTRLSTSARGRAAERRVAWYFRRRGYRILARNVRAGGVELDLIVRRGRRLVFSVDFRKRQRLRRGAEAWLLANPQHGDLNVTFEVVAVRPRGIERVADALV